MYTGLHEMNFVIIETLICFYLTLPKKKKEKLNYDTTNIENYWTVN